jgi:transcriptional regulator with XRE-family HTH domain
MRLYVRIPNLVSLSWGSRVAYARQYRGLSQQKLGEAMGLKNEKVRNRVCRYEKGGRIPKTDRIIRIAEILNVSEGMLRNYDFRNPTDFIYQTLWLEELFPELDVTLHKGNPLKYETCEYFSLFYKEWIKKRKQLQENMISKHDYIEWKLTYIAPGERGSA